MKRSISLIVLIALIFALTPFANAAEVEQATPWYLYINTLSASLSIDEALGIASCEGYIYIRSGSSVKLVCKLQVYENGDWRTLKTWENTGIRSVSIVESYAVTESYTYRTLVIGYVYNANGGLLESDSTSNTKIY